MVLFFIAQLPVSYAVRVDLDRFFSAFSMVVDENRLQIQSWTHRPGYRRQNTSEAAHDPEVIDNAEYVDQEGFRKQINKRWVEYESYTAGHIPWAVCTDRYGALTGVSDGTGNVPIGAFNLFLE
jgi:hypothetical protein